jgi:hypothetical protein
MRRVLRLSVRIGVIAAIGVGIAVVVKKLTAPPADTSSSLEPWPPLSTDTTTSTGADTGTGEEAAAGAEAIGEAAAEAVEETEAEAVQETSTT